MPTKCTQCDEEVQFYHIYCRGCGALRPEFDFKAASNVDEEASTNTPVATAVPEDDLTSEATVPTATITFCKTCPDDELGMDPEEQRAAKNTADNLERKQPASAPLDNDRKEDHGLYQKSCSGFFSRASCSGFFHRMFCWPWDWDCFWRFFNIAICISIAGGVITGIVYVIIWSVEGDGGGGGVASNRAGYVGGVGGGSRVGVDVGAGSGCFPGDSHVEIRRPGDKIEGTRFVFLRDVKINDEVRSGPGFSPVYAFGTRIEQDSSSPLEVLQFHTESGNVLEMTKNHFVYIGKEPSQDRAVLAHDVRIDDLLKTFKPAPVGNNTLSIQRESRVVAINEISKDEGIFHPLTSDGNIVVNGVLASVHATDGIVPVAEFLGNELIGIQTFQQLLYSPLRVLCHLSSGDFCSEFHHDLEDGSHLYLNVVEPLLRFLFPEASWITQVFADRQEKVNFLDKAPHLVWRVWFLVFLLFSYMVEVFLFRAELAVPLLIAVVSLIVVVGHWRSGGAGFPAGHQKKCLLSQDQVKEKRD